MDKSLLPSEVTTARTGRLWVASLPFAILGFTAGVCADLWVNPPVLDAAGAPEAAGAGKIALHWLFALGGIFLALCLAPIARPQANPTLPFSAVASFAGALLGMHLEGGSGLLIGALLGAAGGWAAAWITRRMAKTVPDRIFDWLCWALLLAILACGVVAAVIWTFTRHFDDDDFAFYIVAITGAILVGLGKGSPLRNRPFGPPTTIARTLAGWLKRAARHPAFHVLAGFFLISCFVGAAGLAYHVERTESPAPMLTFTSDHRWFIWLAGFAAAAAYLAWHLVRNGARKSVMLSFLGAFFVLLGWDAWVTQRLLWKATPSDLTLRRTFTKIIPRENAGYLETHKVRTRRSTSLLIHIKMSDHTLVTLPNPAKHQIAGYLEKHWGLQTKSD